MVEKRYIEVCTKLSHYIKDTQTPYMKYDLNEVVDLLNEISDENKGLLKDVYFYKRKREQLFRENEQLKQEIKQLKHWNKCLSEKRHDELKRSVNEDINKMTEKQFKFKRFDVDIANINEIALYEIDNNPTDDLDESNLFYVYSTTDTNVQQIIDKLNSQEEQIKELLQDNDHKFWKLQFMHQFNSTSLIMHEISLAIEQGYEVSDKFKEYLDELKKEHEEGMKKANEQEKW